MKLVYGIKDKPKAGQIVLFALQQLLAIMAATLVVPIVVNAAGAQNLNMDPAAALVGAGVGTLVYLLFTKGRSPVFLGSSFAFLNSMFAATAFGYCGIIIGAAFAGLVYVVIAIIVKLVGVKWVGKLMPPLIIGPTVALIGLSLAGNAVGDLTKASATGTPYSWPAIICGLITIAATVIASTYGKKMFKLIPFIIGILTGYIAAAIFTVIGIKTGNTALLITDFSALTNNFATVSFSSFLHVPKFAFIEAFKELGTFDWAALGSLAVLYVPVAFVVFAEHIADHRNLSTIVESDLLENPGLSRTLLGDGVGSIAGAFMGGCPNTTYGESIACVAVTGNASVVTILAAAIGAIVVAFISPFVAFINTIPSCVMGGVCVTLYGFIAVSGLKMIQKVDLNENRNLFVVSVILITGIGGLIMNFGKVVVTGIATALILGILTNVLLSGKKANEPKDEDEAK